jgi:hypothetical protein
MTFLKIFGWALLVVTSLSGTAFADVAGTLEDYLYCQDEATLIEGRVGCFKCLGTDVEDYENTSSLPSCKTESEFSADNYEKVCQSQTYLEVWGEVWCKIVDTEEDAGTADSDTVADTEKSSDESKDTDAAEPTEKKTSSGCSVTGVGFSGFSRTVVTFLQTVLGL